MCEQTTAERQQFLTGMGAVENSCHSWLIKVVSGLLKLMLNANCLPAVPAAKQCSQSFLLSPAISGPPENTPEPALRMRTKSTLAGKNHCAFLPLQSIRKDMQWLPSLYHSDTRNRCKKQRLCLQSICMVSRTLILTVAIL